MKGETTIFSDKVASASYLLRKIYREHGMFGKPKNSPLDRKVKETREQRWMASKTTTLSTKMGIASFVLRQRRREQLRSHQVGGN